MMHSRGVYLASDRRVLAGGSSSSMSGSNRYSVSVPRSHSHMHLASSGASMQSPTVPTHSASQFSADSRTSLYDKRAVASPRAPPHPSAQQAPQQQGAFMTRASGRRPRGHEAVDWMENVRIVSGGAQESTQSAGTGGTTMAGSMLVDGVEIGTGMEDSVTALGTADGASTVQGGQGDRDSVPLHEELTALARRFESTVRFEKVSAHFPMYTEPRSALSTSAPCRLRSRKGQSPLRCTDPGPSRGSLLSFVRPSSSRPRTRPCRLPTSTLSGTTTSATRFVRSCSSA